MKEYIGILDSGVGGLSVFSHLYKLLPDENYIFFADTLHLPYGTKTKEEILSYTKNILNFFVSKNVKNVVFACNTTSAVAYDELEQYFKNKLKIFPLIQSVAKKATENLEDGDTVAVLATKATTGSKKYTQEIHKVNPNIKVVELDCTGFVEIVENRLYNDKKSIELIKSKFDILSEYNVKRIILGCTHYPYLIDIFKRFLNVEYFDPGLCLAQIVKNNINTTSKKGSIEFYVSKNPQEFILSAKTFFNVDPMLVKTI